MSEQIKKELEAFTEKIDGKLFAIASTETRDRVGDVVRADGWKLDNFKKNPVLLFAHNYLLPPIGIAKNIKVEGKRLVFEPVFHSITQLSKEIKELFEADPPIMRAFSVGFIPLKFNAQNPADILEQELLEISAVPVPANAEALSMISKSIDEVKTKEVSEWLGKNLEVGEVEKKEEKSPACRMKDETEKECVARKIPEIRREDPDMKEEQAVAIAYSLCSKKCDEKDGDKSIEEKKEEQKVEEKIEEKIEEKVEEKKEEIKTEKKVVIPYSETPKANEDEEWDSEAEVKKAEGDGNKLEKMHTWVDSEADNFDVGEKQWYKLPHHKGDGEQAVVWKGVVAAMASLLGARGGVDISEDDKQGVYNHLIKHYAEFDKEPPEFKSYTDEELEKMFGEYLMTKDQIEIKKLNEQIIEQKEGRILSGKNRKTIQDAVASLNQSISVLKDLLEATQFLEEGGGKSIKGRVEVADKPRKNPARLRALRIVARNINELLKEEKHE